MTDSIGERLEKVRQNVARAAGVSGRDVKQIELVAVSKTHSPEAMQEVMAAGQTLFGESRVQEARAKISLLPARARWHFIGHLQKNKIRAALPLFEQFHSVDSLELAEQFNRIAEEESQRPTVLLEVNVAGEASKFGFSPEGIMVRAEELMALDRLEIAGLMTIAPFHPEAEHARPYFAQLRQLRDRLEQDFGIGLPQLSMGMSGDYLVAIEEGATIVRVGSAIFGTRHGKQWTPPAGVD